MLTGEESFLWSFDTAVIRSGVTQSIVIWQNWPHQNLPRAPPITGQSLAYLEPQQAENLYYHPRYSSHWSILTLSDFFFSQTVIILKLFSSLSCIVWGLHRIFSSSDIKVTDTVYRDSPSIHWLNFINRSLSIQRDLQK